jgi:hypothetical protein
MELTALAVAAMAVLAGPGWAPTQQLNQGFVVDGSERAPFASDPRGGVDARGAALVAWSVPRTPGRSGTDLYAAAAPAGQRFGPARLVLRGGDAPEVAVLPDGRVLLSAIHGVNGPSVLLTGKVDGRFGAPRVLGPRTWVSGLIPTPQGALAVLETRSRTQPAKVREIGPKGAVGRARDVGVSLHQREQAARGADGTLAFAVGSRLVIRSPAGRWRRVRIPLGARAVDSQAGVAPDGRISVAAISDPEYGEASAYGRIVVTELQPGARRFGPLRRAPVHPAGRPNAFGPVVAYDGRGRRVVAWIEDTHPDAGEETESAFGRVVAWSGGRRLVLDDKAGDARLLGTAGGVLAASDGGPWRTSLLAGGTRTSLLGPTGRAFPATFGTERALASSRRRTLLAWRGWPDGGIRAALLPALGALGH